MTDPTAADAAADAAPRFRDGVLVSERFGDVYAGVAGALAQARAVFLQGCDLPARWAGRRYFTVAELGFGTGLNMLAVLDAWQRARPPGGHLQLFSVEAYPLPRELAAQALAAHPEVAALAGRLLAQWPAQSAGRLRLDFPDLGATLDLVLADVTVALGGWDGQADAWFLDGFAPDRNPQMWTDAVLQQVAAHTAPGGRIATWSVAGHVRRALAAAGLQVDRRPGFAGKRARLEAVRPGVATESAPPRVAVVGAGIAGAALVRALRALGVGAEVHAAVHAARSDAAPMASGNPAALLAPRLHSGSAVASELHAQAFHRAVTLVRREAPGAIIAEGADWHLKRDEPARAAATLQSGLHPAGSLRLDGDRLQLRAALVVAPARLRRCWLGDCRMVAHRVQEIRHEGGWWLDAAGPFDAVVLAAGIGSAALAGLPLRPVRGQVTTARTGLRPAAESWGGYVVPTDDGLLFGATHGRDDADWSLRAADDAANLAGLAAHRPALAAAIAGLPLRSFAGVRAATGYNQPIATERQPGLFVLGALAGRGFTLAPLLAEHVAAKILGVASPLALAAMRILDCMQMQPPAARPHNALPHKGLDISAAKE